MPFGYGLRTQFYIDISNATARDRIKITFENGQDVFLFLPDSQINKRESNVARLHVDKVRTQARVLEPLYRHAINEAKEHGRRKNRHHYNLDTARTSVDIVLFIRKGNDSFDDSPNVGDFLQVMALYPNLTGSAYRFPSVVKMVEFITV